MARRRSEYCPQGHPITPDNTEIEYRGGNRIQRCRECRHEQYRRRDQDKNREMIEMTRKLKAEMLKVLEEFQVYCHGAGINQRWSYRESRYGVWLSNSYQVMNEHGAYCGWADFSLFFKWNEPLIPFKLQFNGKGAAYLNRKYALREMLEDRVRSVLESTCKSEERTQLLTGADPLAKPPVFAIPAQPFEQGAYLNHGGHLVKDRPISTPIKGAKA